MHRRRASINTAHDNRRAICVVVAEDNDDLRMIMPPLLDQASDLHCAATTAYLDEVAPLIRQHGAQVAVLDIELRGGSVLKQVPELRRQFPHTKFIIHSGHSNPELIRSARERGADAYVLKSGDFDELIEAIRKLARSLEEPLRQIVESAGEDAAGS